MTERYELILVLDSVRSALNVGSLLRVANGMAVKKVITTGITPHPKQPEDERLPHVIERAGRQIAKTSLGSEDGLEIVHITDINTALKQLKKSGTHCIALEQAPGAVSLAAYQPPKANLALVLGNEVDGLAKSTLTLCDDTVEIEMSGTKNSLNVATAGAIALYTLRKQLSTV